MKRQFSSRLQAVVFDLDGTLLDTAPEFISVVQQLREDHNLDPLPEHSIRGMVSHGARALVTLALGLAPEDPGFEPQRLRLLEIYAGALGSATRLYPGLATLLLELEQADIRWGVSTNKPSAYTYPLLEMMNFDPAPGSVVCADQVSQPKPHPEPLYLNCKQLRCSPHQTIYVGDHRRDIQAGRGAGMTTIAATYGYLEADARPGQWGADALAHSSEELGEVIAKVFT